MGLQQVTCAFGFAVSLALGAGCIHVHTDADGKLTGVSLKEPAPAVAKAEATDTRIDPAVEQAGAKVPAQIPSAALAALAKATVKDLPKGAATQIAVFWQNKVGQLPDPTRNGTMIHGVVGQLFLFSSDYKFAPANGNLVFEMFDYTQRSGVAEGARLGTWTYDRETMKKLVTMDERLGKSYAVFLPWPEYDPTVSHVKLTVRYVPDKGYPLYAPASTVTFDNGPKHGAAANAAPPPGALSTAGFGGLPSAVPASPSLAPLDPLPVGGRNAPAAGSPGTPSVNPLPPNLPPLVITATGR